MDEKVFAYLAGIVDGEGSLGMRPTCMNARAPRTVHYQPYLSIVNTDQALIHWLQAMIPEGKVYPRKPNKWSKKQAYMFGVYSRESIRRLLVGMLPYLIIKCAKAQEVLRALEGFTPIL